LPADSVSMYVWVCVCGFSARLSLELDLVI